MAECGQPSPAAPQPARAALLPEQPRPTLYPQPGCGAAQPIEAQALCCTPHESPACHRAPWKWWRKHNQLPQSRHKSHQRASRRRLSRWECCSAGRTQQLFHTLCFEKVLTLHTEELLGRKKAKPVLSVVNNLLVTQGMQSAASAGSLARHMSQVTLAAEGLADSPHIRPKGGHSVTFPCLPNISVSL